MVDQRYRDAPPMFTISARTGAFKYHAVLIETVWVMTKFVFDVRDEVNPTRKSDDGIEVRVPMGLYGFPRIEDRDKFIRRANTAADAMEHKVCFAVTIPVEQLANAQELITGPVAEDLNQGNNE